MRWWKATTSPWPEEPDKIKLQILSALIKRCLQADFRMNNNNKKRSQAIDLYCVEVKTNFDIQSIQDALVDKDLESLNLEQQP